MDSSIIKYKLIAKTVDYDDLGTNSNSNTNIMV